MKALRGWPRRLRFRPGLNVEERNCAKFRTGVRRRLQPITMSAASCAHSFHVSGMRRAQSLRNAEEQDTWHCADFGPRVDFYTAMGFSSGGQDRASRFLGLSRRGDRGGLHGDCPDLLASFQGGTQVVTPPSEPQEAGDRGSTIFRLRTSDMVGRCFLRLC